MCGAEGTNRNWVQRTPLLMLASGGRGLDRLRLAPRGGADSGAIPNESIVKTRREEAKWARASYIMYTNPQGLKSCPRKPQRTAKHENYRSLRAYIFASPCTRCGPGLLHVSPAPQKKVVSKKFLAAVHSFKYSRFLPISQHAIQSFWAPAPRFFIYPSPLRHPLWTERLARGTWKEKRVEVLKL